MSSVEDTPLDLSLASMALESSTQAAESFLNIHELRQMVYRLIDPSETKDYIGFLTSCKTIRAEATEVFVGPRNPLTTLEEEKQSVSYSEFASHRQFGGIRIQQSRPLTHLRSGVVTLPQFMFVNASHGEHEPPNAIVHEYYGGWCALHDSHYRWNFPNPVDHLPMSSTDIDTH